MEPPTRPANDILLVELSFLLDWISNRQSSMLFKATKSQGCGVGTKRLEAKLFGLFRGVSEDPWISFAKMKIPANANCIRSLLEEYGMQILNF